MIQRRHNLFDQTNGHQTRWSPPAAQTDHTAQSEAFATHLLGRLRHQDRSGAAGHADAIGARR
jgi:hypothetical protein